MNEQNTGTLLGVCTECGIAITDEARIGERAPKLKCIDCVRQAEECERAQRVRTHSEAKRNMLLCLIIPALIFAAIAILLSISVPKNTLGIIIFCCLAYLATVLIFWGFDPVCSVFAFFMRGPRLAFGIIFTLDLDGIIFLLVSKLVLWLLGILLSIVSFLFSSALAMLLAPFTFPFALYRALRTPEELDFLL